MKWFKKFRGWLAGGGYGESHGELLRCFDEINLKLDLLLQSRISHEERAALRAATAKMKSSGEALSEAVHDNIPKGGLKSIMKGETNMDADIQAIISQAEANDSAEASAVQVITELATKLEAAIANATSLSAEDRATLQAEVVAMKASATALGAAVVAGTSAAGA